jgi:chemotaxis protein MotB
MPQGPDGKTVIIVKKVVGHGGHHGGSWKVAYADFVTSMMCFFMVLWLVNSASVSTRERVASYFRTSGIFEKGSGTPLEIGGAGILPDTFAPPAEMNSQILPTKRIYEATVEEGEKPDAFGRGGGEGTQELGDNKKTSAAEIERLRELARQIKAAIERDETVIAGFIGQMDVKLDQRGLHLEIMDTATASMFTRGSAEILPEAAQEISKIATLLQKLPNPIDIEGHTDAAPFKTGARDNWILSMERANAARRLLRDGGVAETQISRVVGYAERRLKVPSDPLAAPNRRISISMRFTEQAAVTLKDTGAKETRSKPLARENNEPKEQTNAKEKPGLAIELSTSGSEVTLPPVAKETESPQPPAWKEKDFIFGEKNPFFGR